MLQRLKVACMAGLGMRFLSERAGTESVIQPTETIAAQRRRNWLPMVLGMRYLVLLPVELEADAEFY